MAVRSDAKKYQVKAGHSIFIALEEGLELFFVYDGALFGWDPSWHGVDLFWNHGNPIQEVFFGCAEVAVWMCHWQTAFVHPKDMRLVPWELRKIRLLGQQPVHPPWGGAAGNGQGKLAPQPHTFLSTPAPYVCALAGDVSRTRFNDDFGSDPREPGCFVLARLPGQIPVAIISGPRLFDQSPEKMRRAVQ